MTHITGVAKLLNGVIYPLADIRFSRKTNKPLITSGSVTFPNTINIFSNSSGAVDFNLIPGEYQGIDFKTKVTFDFQVPDLVSVDWSSCLVEEAVVTPPIGYPAEYLTGTVQANQMPAFTGDVTSSAGSLELTIPDHSLANSKLAVMAASTLKGRVLGTTGDPQDLSASQVTGMLVEFSGTSKGLVPLSDDSGVKFLRGDGSWSIPEYSWEDLLTKPTTIDGYAITDAFAHSYVAKAGAYTVVTGDRGKIIETTGTWTLGLTAAATLGSGFSVIIANTSSGTITIDPNSAELIDGAATFALGPGRMVLLVCTGSAWITLALAGSVTTSSTDTIAEKVMKVGDFGIGSSGTGGVATPAITDFTVELASGFYQYTENTATGAPAALAYSGWAIVTRGTTEYTQVIAGRHTSSASSFRWWFGTRTTATGALTWIELPGAGFAAGSVSVPSIAFALDTDTGLYNPAANQIGFAAGGISAALLTSTALTMPGIISSTKPSGFWSTSGSYITVGSSTTPLGGLSTEGSNAVDLTSNGYRHSDGFWRSFGVASTTGAAQVRLDPTGFVSLRADNVKADGSSANPTEIARAQNGQFLTAYGSAAAPGNAFLGDTDTGIFRAASNVLGVALGALEVARFSSTGLMLGTTAGVTGSGGVALQAVGITSALGSQTLATFNATAGTCSIFNIVRSRGATIGDYTAVADLDTLGVIRFRGSDGTTTVAAAQIHAVVDGAPAAGFIPGRLIFQTAPVGGSLTERIRITSAGLVSIGNVVPTTTLHVSGPVRVGSYTIATLPAASAVGAGTLAWCSDATGGAALVTSNGTGWTLAGTQTAP